MPLLPAPSAKLEVRPKLPVETVARRVKRWQGGMMILRWTAAGVLEAERHFRKVAGYSGLPKLVAALRARDTAVDRAHKIDSKDNAA
jgi:hypothetical protein